MSTQTLAEFLRSARARIGKKTRDIAAEVGSNRTTIERWERGITKKIHPGFSAAIARAYNVPEQDILSFIGIKSVQRSSNNLFNFDDIANVVSVLVKIQPSFTSSQLKFLLEAKVKLDIPMSEGLAKELLQAQSQSAVQS